MSLLNNINWEIIVASLGTIIAAVIGFYQLKIALPKPRTRLKTDLEILQLIGDKHEKYTEIKEQVDDLITDIYTTPIKLSQQTRIMLIAMRIGSAIIGCGLAFWTYYLVRDGWTWWAPLTGFYSFVFIFYIFYLPMYFRRTHSRSNE
jgi:hypothetical protein